MSVRGYADVVVRKRPTIVPEDDQHPIAGGLWSLTIDGVEMAHQVVPDGLHISFPADVPGHAHVTVTLRATVDLDLPASVVKRIRQTAWGDAEVVVR
jgi:hypothetical protein